MFANEDTTQIIREIEQMQAQNANSGPMFVNQVRHPSPCPSYSHDEPFVPPKVRARVARAEHNTSESTAAFSTITSRRAVCMKTRDTGSDPQSAYQWQCNSDQSDQG